MSKQKVLWAAALSDLGNGGLSVEAFPYLKRSYWTMKTQRDHLSSLRVRNISDVERRRMKLYANDMSGPVRAVLMTARAIGVDMELEEINVYNKEQFSDEYLKLNPQHTIPTLVDDDFVLCDSHAIVGYLVSKYSQDDSLYPKDPKKRALVDQRLYFDSGTLYPRVNDVMHSIVVENEKEIPTEKISAITETYRLLDIFLKNTDYIAADSLTIADFCCAATVSTATIVTPISKEKYPQLSTWFKKMKSLPLYEETNATGLNRLDALVELKLGRPTALLEQGE